MTHRPESELLQTRNTARFFVETRHVAWVLLVGTMLWGAYGYLRMPQRKDPEVPVRIALAVCPWPGASATRIEQLVTRKIEERVAENPRVERIDSVSRTSVALVYVHLVEAVKETGKEFDDIQLKLDAINDLPEGAGPIEFIKDFGDTAALMLTVASPRTSELEVELRARAVREAIEGVRAARSATPPPAGSAEAAVPPGWRPVSLIYAYPTSLDPGLILRHFKLWATAAAEDDQFRAGRFIQGSGFVGIDAFTDRTEPQLLDYARRFIETRMRPAEFHPDAWRPTAIFDTSEIEPKMAASAVDKYTYRELDDFTDLIQRTLQTVPQVSKVTRSGILDERIFLDYSQERLAAYGVRPGNLPDVLKARNIIVPGGILEVQGKNLSIDPSGEFHSEREIGDVLLPGGAGGRPLYLRDLTTVVRGYDLPARFLNFYGRRNERGEWERTRAVTLAVQMRSGEQIAGFGHAVDAALDDLRARLPRDLLIARTSDQPLQVEENVHLFMSSLDEAIALVVLVSLIGFWEWRSALLMALSIPITLAMTFGLIDALGVDLQQVSIASLIIALGLLVDDPVVAGDAIKRELAAGRAPLVAAWLGPTRLATAILFATITNIVAYLPFLLLPGDTGRFLWSLPVVIGSSLVASRIASMTFVPLLGYYLLKPTAEKPIEERRKTGFASFYYRTGSAAIRRRWLVLAGSLLLLASAGFFMSRLRQQFFPNDLSYLSYVDVWLPEDAPLSATQQAALTTEDVIREVAAEYGRRHETGGHEPHQVLQSLTTFLGGGGPRFWFSVSPEMQQLNYAQILIQVRDKHDTNPLVDELQRALTERVAGARVDVRRLETGSPVGIPVAVRISGDDAATLRRFSAEATAIFRSLPIAARVRDDWGAESFSAQLRIDPDRANLAGVSNLDVAASSATAMNGFRVGTLREGNKQIPIVARLRMDERSQLSDITNLYVYSTQGNGKVPLGLISRIEYGMRTEKLQRRNQFRTITVSAFPESGVLPSEVFNAAWPRLEALKESLPPGYRLEVGGEQEEQVKGFRNLAIVMALSVAMIFLALVLQFRHAAKPFIVFAAIPYGMVGALAALWIMGSPFGFMAFLGVASLVGVIVSHVIVLFDFIEEARERGEPLELALLDAGILRLRPVMITVGATVIALIPLALHGGPLWEPLCYAQIGGLTAATFVTLLLVPVLYATAVRDLRLVRWEPPSSH